MKISNTNLDILKLSLPEIDTYTEEKAARAWPLIESLGGYELLIACFDAILNLMPPYITETISDVPELQIMRGILEGNIVTEEDLLDETCGWYDLFVDENDNSEEFVRSEWYDRYITIGNTRYEYLIRYNNVGPDPNIHPHDMAVDVRVGLTGSKIQATDEEAALEALQSDIREAVRFDRIDKSYGEAKEALEIPNWKFWKEALE